MTRGRKPTPPGVKLLRGTFRRDRQRAAVVPPVADAPAAPPSWLSAYARRLWQERVTTYSRRGMSVAGCEGALAAYCQLEAQIARRWQKGQDVPPAWLNALRLFAGEFHDTPSSQIGRGTPAAPPNRFAQFVRPPTGMR